MSVFFSAANNAFYDDSIRESYYEKFDAWPGDAIELTDDEINTYRGAAPQGKLLSSKRGRPAWIPTPAPKPEELRDAAERHRALLIATANAYMSDRQWPGKAAIGRLKGDELAQYNLWLDYLDALYAVNTSSAPDIEWPIAPAA